jgi:hypothetical protein
MATIELDSQECGQLMFVLANAEGKGITWALVNPLLMKIGEQLRLQAAVQRPRGRDLEVGPPDVSGYDGKEEVRQ